MMGMNNDYDYYHELLVETVEAALKSSDDAKQVCLLYVVNPNTNHLCSMLVVFHSSRFMSSNDSRQWYASLSRTPLLSISTLGGKGGKGGANGRGNGTLENSDCFLAG